MSEEVKKELTIASEVANSEIQIIEARAMAEFQLSPIGQELKRFETIQRMGKMYAMSTIIPDCYKNNVSNCAIAIETAIRMNINPVMVMQNLYIVHGQPAWSSKFLVATVNSCGRFTPLRYECNNKEGDEYGWRCYAYEKSDAERKDRLEGTWITWAMVKAEGWCNKTGSKWKTMPEQMFRYRAAAAWTRIYAPEISMGYKTEDEQQDITDVPYTEIPTAKATAPRPSVADFDESVEIVDPETGEVKMFDADV